MENLNFKAFALALVLLIFTYTYYMKGQPNFVVFAAVILFSVMAVIALVLYFFSIKFIGHALSSGKVYPHLAFHILWPFVVMSLTGWLIYGGFYVKPFGSNNDFSQLAKVFVTKHLVFIAICSIAIGFTFFPSLKDKVPNEILLKKNQLYLAATFGVFLLGVGFVFFAKKINQPALDNHYAAYKSLEELDASPDSNIFNLVETGEYNSVMEPYVLPERNELILIAHYNDANEDKAIETIYRINRDGDIVASLNKEEVVNDSDVDFFPLICRDGILTDFNGKKLISWIFDGNKEKQPVETFKLKTDWKIDTLKQSTGAVKVVHFYKTGTFHCNDIADVKYNGNRYYEVKQGNDILKLRLDDVFSHRDNIQNCDEKKLEYYKPVGFNFSLLRLNEKSYYIVKARH